MRTTTGYSHDTQSIFAMLTSRALSHLGCSSHIMRPNAVSILDTAMVMVKRRDIIELSMAVVATGGTTAAPKTLPARFVGRWQLWLTYNRG